MRLLTFTIIALACSTLGCAAGRTAALTPAKTPTDAMKQWWQAIADGDQAAYGERVIVHSRTGYCSEFADWRFASARLREVVRASQLRRDDGEDRRGRYLTPGIAPIAPSADVMPGMMASIEKVEWKIEGSSASQVGGQLSVTEWGAVSARRAGNGWVIVLDDPDTIASATELQRFVSEFKATTALINTAIDKVQSGEFKTVREINEYLEAEFAVIKPKEKV